MYSYLRTVVDMGISSAGTSFFGLHTAQREHIWGFHTVECLRRVEEGEEGEEEDCTKEWITLVGYPTLLQTDTLLLLIVDRVHYQGREVSKH